MSGCVGLKSASKRLTNLVEMPSYPQRESQVPTFISVCSFVLAVWLHTAEFVGTQPGSCDGDEQWQICICLQQYLSSMGGNPTLDPILRATL